MTPGEVIELAREQLLGLIQTDAELSEIFMRAFILRRIELIAGGYGDVVLILSDLSRRSQAESRGHGDQLGKRVCLHFAHHLTSVRLDRDLADPKFAADLLVQQTRDDQRHHLAFAWSE